MFIKTKSSKEAIARFLREFNISDSSYNADYPQWIEDAIDIMNLPNYYVPRRVVRKVIEYKTSVPCDIDHLYGIWCTDKAELAENTNTLRRLVMQNNPLIGDMFKTDTRSTHFGSISGNTIHTSFRNGYIYIAYKGIPLDCDGYPIVPDYAKVNEAIQYYFIYRMALSGHKHPVIDFQTAFQLWEKKYPAAANEVNWMDRQDYQEFTEMWTNPILGDLHADNYIS